MITAANVDLFVPIVVTMVMVRFRGALRLPTRMLSGLKFFVPRYFSSTNSTAAATKADEDVPIEEVVSRLNFTMTEVDHSKTSQVILATQPCFNLFEILAQLLLGALASSLFSKAWHCALPEAEYSFFVPLVLLVGLTLSLNGLFVTADGEIAIPAAMVTFLAFFGVLHFAPQWVLPRPVLRGMVSHGLALIQQISASPPAVSRYGMVLVTKIALSAALALLTAALITPARRMAQLLVKMSVGRPFELAPKRWLIALWLDYALPLPLAFLFSSLLTQRLIAPDAPAACAGDVCPNTTDALPRRLLLLQVACLVAFLQLKFLVVKKYLQSFLDYSVETLSLSMVSQDLVLVKKLKAVVEERSAYLMTAATQSVAVPVLLAFWLLLKLRSIPHSTGVCYSLRGVLGLDQAAVASAQQAYLAFNSTAVALQNASLPYLDEAVFATFGVSLINPMHAFSVAEAATGTATVGAQTGSAMSAFAAKMAQIYAPPADVAQGLIDGGIFWTLALWFLLSTGFLLRWLVDMQALRTAAAKEVI